MIIGKVEEFSHIHGFDVYIISWYLSPNTEQWCLCLKSFYLSRISIVERITLQIKRFGQNSVCQMNYWWFSKSPEKSLFFPVVNQSWGNNFHYITINQLFMGEIQMILHVNLDIIDNNDDYLCFAWKLKPNHSFDACLKRHSSEIHCVLSANIYFCPCNDQWTIMILKGGSKIFYQNLNEFHCWLHLLRLSGLLQLSITQTFAFVMPLHMTD